jgi:uncharacterized protein (DUF2336 family)
MSVIALRNRLTDEDVRRLVKGDSEEDRALAARKICRRIDQYELTEPEKLAAQSILDMISRDAADLVRRAMAVTLQSSKNLPHDIAVRLANDIDTIAAPVLVSSPVLTEEDLVDIVRASTTNKRCAVAARESLPTRLVHAILDTGDSRAAGVAAANDGADFDELAYQRAFAEFCETPEVMDAFVARSYLPLNITETLISHVSDQAIDRLIKTHALPPQLAVELAESARERATVDLVDQAGLSHDPRHFTQQLRINGRLTPSLILRALLRGHVEFFEHAMAELAELPHAKAWLLVHDAGPLGLRAVFDRTGLPSKLFPAIRACIDVVHQLEAPYDENGRAQFRRILAERALTRFQGVPEEDLDYVLDRMTEEQEPRRAAG